jgi:6-phosphogluconolactonase (cycloisomerase 2 family)
VAFSLDGRRLAVAHDNSPFITVYDLPIGQAGLPAGQADQPAGQVGALVKIPDPEILPTGNGNGVAFSHDGRHLAVAHSTSPFVTIYNVAVEGGNIIAPATLIQARAFIGDPSFIGIGYAREDVSAGALTIADILVLE